MNFDGYNMRTQSYDDVVAAGEKALGVTLDRSRTVYGTQGTSVGFPSSAGTWVHFSWRRLDRVTPLWTGLEAASAIAGVSKPRLLRSYRWLDDARQVVWRADESDLIDSSAVCGAGVISSVPDLPDQWWSDMKASLTALGGHKTNRTTMPQAHLTKRINEVFGDHDLDTTITEWVTSHGDLHWGNITGPSFHILDWEDWGVGPRGLDAAILWTNSLPVPEVADRVQREFADDLGSRSGLLAQLLFCSNVIRLAKKRPTPGPLVEPATRESHRLLNALAAAPART